MLSARLITRSGARGVEWRNRGRRVKRRKTKRKRGEKKRGEKRLGA